MGISIKQIQPTDTPAWDAYVHAHPQATLYHLSGWKNVIEKTYGHKTYYLMATKNIQQPVSSNQHPATNTHKVVGILQLVHLKHFLFGNSLVSMPFLDFGGILADDEQTEKCLLTEAIKLAQKVKAHNIELRHIKPLSWFNNPQQSFVHPINPTNPLTHATKSHKVRMLLSLPESSEVLMKSFNSKLKSCLPHDQKTHRIVIHRPLSRLVGIIRDTKSAERRILLPCR